MNEEISERIKKYSRLLRKNQTDAEYRIWKHIRARRFEGLKFKRQESIDMYIADFVCYEKRIIIEMDGGQHANNEKDKKREAYLIKQGFDVLRFWDNDVLKNTDGVLESIRQKILAPSSRPSPARGEGEGQNHDGKNAD
jgi:very-short-patch-repair endonuclease